MEPLRPIIMLHPFEMVTVDYAGPFKPVGGHVYVLVIIENMTGFLEMATSRTATGSTTIKALNQYFRQYGYSRVIHSD